MFRLFFLLFLLIFQYFFSQQVSGTITDEEENALPAVMVFNMKTEKFVYTSISGEFTIEASLNDELRFVRKNYDRNSKILKEENFIFPLRILMIRSAEEIEEVQVPAYKLSGDINKDAKNLTKIDKVEQLQKEIGVPKPPEKPREKPAEVTKDILLPLAFAQLNVQGIYDVVSGKARRQKNLYRYEDLQDNILWIRKRVSNDYFVKAGIPEEKISEFIQFSIGMKPEIPKYVKAGNLSRILLDMEETLPEYLGR